MAMIAPLDLADATAAIALWRECGLTRPWNDPAADIALATGGPHATLLAAKSGGRLVGTIMAGVDGHRGWVYYLAVAAEARRGGLGRALMAAAEAWVAARGVGRLNLMVRADNADAAGFYARLGYVRSDVSVWQRDLPDAAR